MEILLSIKPEWAELIYRGEKTHELRKSFPPQAKKIWFYETRPVQKITGFAIVQRIESLPPREIWERIRNEFWTPKSFRPWLKAYYKNRKTGSLITLIGAIKLKKTRSLNSFCLKLPPLSYFILQ